MSMSNSDSFPKKFTKKEDREPDYQNSDIKLDRHTSKYEILQVFQVLKTG